ncbi:tyrosine-protein kinase STYK1-like [Stigmatopora argus]
MSTNATTNSTCQSGDNLCEVVTYRLDVIVVPTVLLGISAIMLIIMFLLAYRHRRGMAIAAAARARSRGRPRRRTRHLQGIDAPPGINPLEHEEVPMAVHRKANGTDWRPGPLREVTALPRTLPVASDDSYLLYRARMENKSVVLRVLKDSASAEEQREFLSFASFVSGLGPHPFLPVLLGVASRPPPVMMVMEDMRHQDLLRFLWKCRRSDASSTYNMTEKRVFTMAAQVASALEYLHRRRCVHGNVGARSVLVSGDLTAKLWGLGCAHRRRSRTTVSPRSELKRWQPPEMLTRGDSGPSGDVWSFGLLLYEMSTLGEPPFAEVPSTDLQRHIQKGNPLRHPAGCSGALFAIMSSCCRSNPGRRVTVATLLEKLQGVAGEADGRTPIRAAAPVDLELYMRQAGYEDAYNYDLL